MKISQMSAVLVAVVLAACTQERPQPDVPPDPIPEPPVVLPPLPPAPPVDPGNSFVSLERFESEMLNFLYAVSAEDRLNTRFVNVCGPVNEGDDPDPLVQAADKLLNGVSLDRDLLNTVTADDSECIRSFDLRDIGQTRIKWEVILANDPFRIISQTARGLLIQQLTQTRQPWLHGDNMAVITLDAPVYYNIMEIPSVLADFYDFLGVDLQQDFDDVDNDLFLVGKTNSPISIQKARMALRTESRDGAMWSTYDTDLNLREDDPNTVFNDINLFEAPFPIEARSQRTFAHNAQEFIFHLPNDMHGYALFEANGAIQEFAPLTTVVDVNAGGLDPTIRNALSCNRCHANGILEIEDEIAASVIGNPNFNNIDVQKVRAFFGNNGLQAAIDRDNRQYCGALDRIGISCNDPDPINRYTDSYRNEWSAAQLAGFLFLTEDDLKLCIRSSDVGQEQLNQLLQGSSVELDQVITTVPLLIRDCNLFADDLGE